MATCKYEYTKGGYLHVLYICKYMFVLSKYMNTSTVRRIL